MLTENVIVDLLRQSSLEFRQLEESHHRLDGELAELQKRIQKEKLAKKDKMAELMRLYREHDARAAAR